MKSCEKAEEVTKNTETKHCAGCDKQLPVHDFEQRSRGRYRAQCKICEKVKKKLPKGMRVCVDCEATLPQKAFLKYENGYHKKCKRCETKE